MQKGIMLKNPKNKAYVICFSFASFVNIASFHQYCELPSVLRASISSISSFVLPYFLAAFLFISPCSSTPSCLPGKDTPRAFGASFRRHAAPRTLVLTFFSLASTLYSVSPGRSEGYRCRILFSTLRPRDCRCRLTRP